MTVVVHGTDVDVVATFIAMVVAGGLFALSRELRWHGQPAGQVTTVLAPLAGFVIGVAVAGPDALPEDVAWGGFLVGVLFAALAAGSNRYRSVVPWLVLVSSIGVYLSTPDTERAVIFGAVAVALVLVSLVLPISSAGLLASPALLCIGWIAATDGEPRTAAVVAAIGCAGALPFLRLSSARDEIIVVAHIIAVLVASRLAERQDSTGDALAIVVLEFVALLCTIIVFAPRVNDTR
jgi:hypothetical protein